MKIILLQDLARLGKRGEVKEVADGFALNVLIAKNQAVRATPAELSKWKQLEDKKTYQKELLQSSFLKLIHELQGKKLTIEGLKHDKGHLFAAIGKESVAEAIFKATGLSVHPNQIVLKTPLKTLGEHSFELEQNDKKSSIAIELLGKK